MSPVDPVREAHDLLKVVDVELARTERLYDVASVAKTWGVCAFTVRRRIKAGDVRVVKVGAGTRRAHYRVPESEVRRLMLPQAIQAM